MPHSPYPLAFASLLLGGTAAALMPGHASAAGLEERIRTQLPPSPAPLDEAAPVATLADAIALAHERNPELLSERALTRSVDERLVQARAGYGPTLTASGEYAYTHSRYDMPSGPAQSLDGWTTTAALVFSQPLYSSGRITAGVRAAEADIDLARQSLRQAEMTTLLNVFTAYVHVQRDRNLRDIAQQNLASLQKQFSDNKSRFRVREVTQTDLDQVVTRLEIGKAGYLSAEAQLSTSNGYFLQNIGALPAENLTPPPSPLRLPESLAEAQKIAEGSNPVLLGAFARERMSRALVRQAQADLGPQVSLQGSLVRDPQTDFTDRLHTTTLRSGVVVTMPLWSSGANYSRIREAREQRQSDRWLIDKALRDVRASVQQAWNSYIAARNSLTSLAQATGAATRAYDGAVIQEKAGARTTLDVLDLLRDLLNVRSQYETTRAEVEVAKASLLAATGQLDPDVFAAQARPYDPATHLRHVSTKGDSLFVAPVVKHLDSPFVPATNRGAPYRDPALGLQADGLAPDAATPDDDTPSR